MSGEINFKKKYYQKKEGIFSEKITWMDKEYEKEEDLRYGVNPHQSGIIYKPKSGYKLRYDILKVGKGGLSQTNWEDINYAIKILKYFNHSCCVIMKHVNPCGVSIGEEEIGSWKKGGIKELYIKTRQVDLQAAFGGVVVFNDVVDQESAKEMMNDMIEIVVAPEYAEGSLEIFNDYTRFKKNKQIRIIRVKNIEKLPKYRGEKGYQEVKVLEDGRIIVFDSYLTRIRNKDNLINAYNEDKRKGKIVALKQASPREYEDLLFSWYINIGVRSNGIVIAKNGTTLGIGTGEQDRIGSVLQALYKAQDKYQGAEKLEGAVLSSDGFFPFCDTIEKIGESGIKAIVQPGGSIRDYEIIQRCNDYGLAMVFTNERCFSHH